MVYCCQTYEEVKEGDYGCVVRLDQDGLQDLNVQATWFSKGGTYWVSGALIAVSVVGKMLPCFFSTVLFCCLVFQI